MRYKLEQNHSLQSMLIKPIQRITRYPLLLSQLMVHSSEKRQMQLAYEKMLSITREANDRVHLKNFEESDVNFCRQIKTKYLETSDRRLHHARRICGASTKKIFWSRKRAPSFFV